MQGSFSLGVLLGVVLVISIVSLFLKDGYSKKMFSALVGTVLGVVITMILYYAIAHFSKFTGFLYYYPDNLVDNYTQLDYKLLFFTAIVLGMLGMLLHVTSSIANHVAFVQKHFTSMVPSELLARGLLFGREMLGSVFHLIVFVYLGVFAPIVIAFSSSQNYLDFVNSPDIHHEIIRVLISSLGLFASIPLTVFLSTLLESKNKQIAFKGGSPQEQFKFNK